MRIQKDKPKKTAKKRNKINILPNKKGLVIIEFAVLILAMAFMVMLVLVNAFPPSVTVALLALVFGLIFLIGVLFADRKKKYKVNENGERVLKKNPKHIAGVAVAIFFIAVFGLSSYYLANTYSMFSRISGAVNEKSVASVTENSFNVYITGIDQWNREKGTDLERSDVNMIVTVCPQTRTLLLTSMPRDSYVPLHTSGQMDKLTHSGIYGVEETLATVEDWFGIDLNYYIKVNFSTVVRIIDAIGGIDVESPVAFKSDISKYEYEKGMNHLDGKAALYFARERHAFKKEDEARIANQQRVMKACMEKALSSKTILMSYTDILEACSEDLETNFSTREMAAFIKMQLGDLGEWTIIQQAVTGTGSYEKVASMSSANEYFVSIPNQKSVDACVAKIQEVMNPSEADVQEVQGEVLKNQQTEAFRSTVGGEE